MPGSTAWSRAEFKPSFAHPTQLHNTQGRTAPVGGKTQFSSSGTCFRTARAEQGATRGSPKQRSAKEPTAHRQKEFRLVPDPVSALRREKTNNSPDLRQGGRCPVQPSLQTQVSQGAGSQPTLQASPTMQTARLMPRMDGPVRSGQGPSPGAQLSPATSRKNSMGLLEAGPGHSSAAPPQPQRTQNHGLGGTGDFVFCNPFSSPAPDFASQSAGISRGSRRMAGPWELTLQPRRVRRGPPGGSGG